MKRLRKLSYRFLFCISNQHLLPTSGIGTFFIGFKEWCEDQGHIMDVCLDIAPLNKGMLDGLNYYYPIPSHSYGAHSSYFFYNDGVNIQKVENFKTSILDAMNKCLYDAVICNTPESAFSAYTLGLQNITKVIYYTHMGQFALEHPPKSPTFTNEYIEFFRSLTKKEYNLDIGTQSGWNQAVIDSYSTSRNVWVLPLFLPKTDYDYPPMEGKQFGALFIGRYEDNKNPEEYINMIEKTNIPPKVLTNEKGAAKFAAKFKERGIEYYDIRYNLRGEEKYKFIASAKVAYHPSKMESFGYSALETIPYMPTFALRKYEWHNNFVDIIAIEGEVNYIMISNAYHNGTYNNDKFLDEYMDYANISWNIYLEKNKVKEGRTYNNAFTKHLDENINCTLYDVFDNIVLYRETLINAYQWYASNPDKIKQEKTRTILSLDNNFEMEEENSLEGFF